MKHFKFAGNQLTAALRDKIAEQDPGIYVVYGAFIDGTSLNLTRLYKGNFKDILLRIDDPSHIDPANVEYLLPVPEYIVAHDDPEYAKYLNIHLVPSSDIEDDEVMLRKFCEAYTKKLSAVAVEDVPEAGEEATQQVAAAGQTLGQMEENVSKLQESTALLATLQQQALKERGGQAQLEAPQEPAGASDPSVVTDVSPKE